VAPKNKFFDKSKLPDNVICYEYMEDTEVPHIKKITTVSKIKEPKYSRYFCEAIRDKKKKNQFGYPKFFNYDGNLVTPRWVDDQGIDNLSSVYFQYNDMVYKIFNGSMDLVVCPDLNLNDALKVEFGLADLLLNEVADFFAFVEFKKARIYEVRNEVVLVYENGTLMELGRPRYYHELCYARKDHNVISSTVIDSLTCLVCVDNFTPELLKQIYTDWSKVADEYGRYHDDKRAEYEEFKKARRESSRSA